MNEGETISGIVKGMDLGRKPKVTKQEKEAFAALKDAVGGVKKDVDKLNLRLWHAGYKRDYHSLSVEEVRQALRQLRQAIDEIIEKEL